MFFPSTIRTSLWIAVVLCLGSAVPASGQQLSPDQIELARNGVRVLNTYCKKCHGDGQVYPGLDVYDRAGLLNPTNGEDPYIVAGDPSASRIWKIVHGAGKRMPPEKQPQPSEADKEVLKQWISAGAHFPPQQREKREFLGDRTIVKLIAADLDLSLIHI